MRVTVFAHSDGLDETLQLYLQQSFCLPILQYVNGALRFTQQQLKSLNARWNSVFRKIFKFQRWESVSQFINGLGYLNFTHLYYLSVMKFTKSLFSSPSIAMRNLMTVFIRGSEFSQMLHRLNVNLEMLIYTIEQLIRQKFSNLYSN